MTTRLPHWCYATMPSDGSLILLTRGESGYTPTKGITRTADELNAVLGVSKAQAEAMLAGSMFGFHTPAANPDNYDAEGNLK